MARVTGRYCCLACGGYWKTKSETPQFCPYCSDRYYCDNVDESIPPVIRDIHVVCKDCNQEYYVESYDDHTVCPICGKPDALSASIKPCGDSLIDYQNKILKNIGL